MSLTPKHTPGSSSAHRTFTDRESFIAAFDRALDAFDPEQHRVVVYYGVGGIGKTALRQHLARRLEAEEEVRWAAVDFHAPSNRQPENALFVVRNELRRKHGFRFPSFDIAYAVYWERAHPQTALSKKQLPLLDEGDLLVDLITAVEDVPGLGLLTKIPRALHKMNDAAQQWWTQRGSADLQDLAGLEPHEVLERLPMFWASDLKEQLAVTGERVVLFLDTYEALWDGKRLEHHRFTADEWVREWIKHLPEVLWVIAGREKLYWPEVNAAWGDALDQHLVGTLADEDARRFLQAAGVDDDAVTAAIIEGAEGVPFYMDLALDTYDQIQQAEDRTPTADDFGRTPRKVIDRFLRYVGREERLAVEVLAAARVWDRDLFAELMTEFQTGYPPAALDELCRFSFVEPVEAEAASGAAWTLHALMRTGVQEHNPEQAAAVHAYLFEHYEAVLDEVDPRAVTELQRQALAEAFYHGQQVLDREDFIAWYREKDDAFEQAAQWRLLIPMQETLVGFVEVAFGEDHEQAAYAWHNLADLYQRQARYEEAEPLYQRTLGIVEQALGPEHPHVATTLNNLAGLYESQGRHEEAAPLYQRSLRIKEQALGEDHPSVATTLNNLAGLYESQGRYEEAAPLYQRSLRIMEERLGADHPNTRIVRGNYERFLREHGTG